MAFALKRKRDIDEAKPVGSGSFSGILMFWLVIIATIFAMSVFFRVSNIDVVGNEHYTDDEIIRAIDIEEGDNLFFFDRFAALSRVFAKLPYVDEVSIERRLPNYVKISVTESKALAYIVVGDEDWTIDRNCKVLGKAIESELSSLIAIEGISPGTLMIGEPLVTADNDTELVEHIGEVLYQIEERNIYQNVTRVDFSNPNKVQVIYGSRFTIKIGNNSNTEHKFGMIVSVLDKLTDEDVGIIDVSDNSTAHFSPN